MVDFRYEPLDLSKRSIRLLQIHPGKGGEAIRCDLVSSNLDEHPEFSALSYAWDHDGRHSFVKCNGLDFQVGLNLSNFLSRYRQRNSVCIWVDAICIDQSNIPERNHQVAQMREVYSRAACVIAWLGESKLNDDAIFKMVSTPVKSWDNQTFLIAAEFLTKRYFSRVWIVQEVLMAAKLEFWCGDHRVDGDALSLELLRFIAPSHSFDDHAIDLPPTAKVWESPGRKLLSHRKTWQKAKSQPTFARSFRLRALLESFGSLKSTEPVDKIYALLGISNDTNEGPRSIQPDYNKPPVEVLVDVLCNQHGKTGPRDAEDHDFITIVRRMLGVSRKDFARYLTGNFEDTKEHLFVLMAGLSPKLSLRFVDTVDRCSHAPNSPYNLAHPKWTGCQWHKLEVRVHFDNDLKRSTAALMAGIAGGAALPGKQGQGIENNADVIDVMSRSITESAERCASAILPPSSLPDDSHNMCGGFVGERGISGTVFGPSSRVQTSMSLAVLADINRPQVALVLQSSLHHTWSLSAVAYLSTPPSQPPFPSISRTTINPSQALLRNFCQMYAPVRWKRTERAKSPENGTSITTVCLQYCETIDLLDLCRCGVLDHEQLKKLVVQALEEESLDEPHRCGHTCSTLRLGTTWSN